MAAGYPVPHERDHVMSSTAKPYQKPHQKQQQFPKPYQKDKQWVQPELPFNDKPWREQPLTGTEIEELFWRELVQLGWRIHTYPSGGQDRKNIVLPCPDCNRKIDMYTWDWVSKADASKMSSAEYVDQRIKDHQVDCKSSIDACYKCNGEGILQSGEECDC
jgi:hypothetical protein